MCEERQSERKNSITACIAQLVLFIGLDHVAHICSKCRFYCPIDFVTITFFSDPIWRCFAFHSQGPLPARLATPDRTPAQVQAFYACC